MTPRRLLLATVSASLLFVHPADVLAASGWLLMVPPIKEETMTVRTIPEPVGTGEWSVEDKQPYSKWEQHRAYDKAEDREFGRSRLWSEAVKHAAEIKEKRDEV